MAQTGYTPVSLYYTTTPAAAPSPSNLVDGELAINITDGKLFYKDNLGAIQYLASLTPTTSVQLGSLGVGTAASGTTGEIRATNNVTAYYSSDAKFKENVQTIPNAVDKVLAIGGKTFDWTDAYIQEKGGEDGYFITKGDFGVVAQDVKAAFPQAVRERADGSLAVDYAKLSALAFAAIAELKAEIDQLKGK